LFGIANAQNTLLPPAYKMIAEVRGDLDKDGIEERAVVYNVDTVEKEEGEGIDRALIIYKKDPKTKTWKIWYRSLTAIGNTRDGGMMGDPFEGIEIVKGILLVSESGGSSWKWSHTDKYRFQANDFILIGYESFYGKPCQYWEGFDYNLVTGKIDWYREHDKCEDEDPYDELPAERKESFQLKFRHKISMKNRRRQEIEIITPKYKETLYL
jgi:hypothetical protein